MSTREFESKEKREKKREKGRERRDRGLREKKNPVFEIVSGSLELNRISNWIRLPGMRSDVASRYGEVATGHLEKFSVSAWKPVATYEVVKDVATMARALR